MVALCMTKDKASSRAIRASLSLQLSFVHTNNIFKPERRTENENEIPRRVFFISNLHRANYKISDNCECSISNTDIGKR